MIMQIGNSTKPEWPSFDDEIDELSKLCEIWKRNRERGRESNPIRYALIMAMRDMVEHCDSLLVS